MGAGFIRGGSASAVASDASNVERPRTKDQHVLMLSPPATSEHTFDRFCRRRRPNGSKLPTACGRCKAVPDASPCCALQRIATRGGSPVTARRYQLDGRPFASTTARKPAPVVDARLLACARGDPAHSVVAGPAARRTLGPRHVGQPGSWAMRGPMPRRMAGAVRAFGCRPFTARRRSIGRRLPLFARNAARCHSIAPRIPVATELHALRCGNATRRGDAGCTWSRGSLSGMIAARELFRTRRVSTTMN